jgi:glucose-6-phosphate dehydrogenase assembly protein OpcA
MIIDLPSTSSAAVARALVDLREQYGAVALGRVLTLVVLADGADIETSIAAANHASHEHPLRVILVQNASDADERGAEHPGSPHLDAQVRVGGDAGASEVVLLRRAASLTEHVSSLVTPLLLPDAPIVAWWAGHAPPETADTSIGAMASRRITDATGCRNPLVAIRDRAEHYRPGDGDLAWARLTLWRAALAGAMDVLTTPTGPPPVTGIEVQGSAGSPSVDLLGAWLAWALRSSSQVRRVPGHGVAGVRLELADGSRLVLERPQDEALAHLSIPGQPTRPVALAPRTTEDCLAEELRRLEPDEVFGEVLQRGLPRVIPA